MQAVTWQSLVMLTVGSPREPEIEPYDVYPLTDNDPVVTDRVRSALVAEFGVDQVTQLAPIPA
ncbi:hypothetical protein [Nostocoides australiense]